MSEQLPKETSKWHRIATAPRDEAFLGFDSADGLYVVCKYFDGVLSVAWDGEPIDGINFWMPLPVFSML